MTGKKVMGTSDQGAPRLVLDSIDVLSYTENGQDNHDYTGRKDDAL